MRKKYPLKYDCVKYLIFSMMLFAVINLLRVAEPAICGYTRLCVYRLPEWIWSVFLFFAIAGLVLFVIKGYLDLVRQSYLERDRDNSGRRRRETAGGT